MGTTSRPPKWIKPQLARLVDEAPTGAGWLLEIKYHGYRMHAWVDGGQVKLLPRTGTRLVASLSEYDRGARLLKVKSAFLDGGAVPSHSDGVPVIDLAVRQRVAGIVDTRSAAAADEPNDGCGVSGRSISSRR